VYRGDTYRLRFAEDGTEYANRHWLVPLKKNEKVGVIEVLPDGSELVGVAFSAEARRTDRALPQTMTARRVT
jgi:hypothetical protein